MIGFGCVKVGSDTERLVNVFNPSRAITAEVKLDRKLQSVKGLGIFFNGKSPLHKKIPPMGSETLHITWRPDAVTSLTEMVELRLNNSSTLIITVTGVAAQEEVKYFITYAG